MKEPSINKKRKINWADIKDRILKALKFTVFTVVMIMGFWLLYTMVWYRLGFPLTDAAQWLLFVQAIVSEVFFLKWLDK